MTKAALVSAALIAAGLFTTPAIARNDVTARHAAAKVHRSVVDCMRAPDVGAFASDPYPVPPCMPNSASGPFQ